MARRSSSSCCLLLVAAATALLAVAAAVPPTCERIECPAYEVVDSANGFEIRRYTDAMWVSTYPAGSVVSRQALRSVTLGGVRMPAGVNIYVPVLTVHLDPAMWGADTREFHSDRFAAARPQPPPHAYLPFGAGARTCLRQGFAMAELKVLLALVLSRFELSLSPAYVHSPALRLIVEPKHGGRRGFFPSPH